MPQDPAASLSTLLRSSSIQDHDEILKAANAALKTNKNDVASQQSRVVALLKLDRFDDALRALDEGGDKVVARCSLEKAYALYKTGKLDEAREFLTSTDQHGKGSRHVAAQVAYRAENFQEALDIYKTLLDSKTGDEESDIAINVRAAHAQLLRQDGSSSVANVASGTESFELCFNEACALIARGALEKATILLQRALRMCDTSDLTDTDKQLEMQPILMQLAYTYANMGKLKEAQDTYASFTASSNSGADLLVVAKNNESTIESKPGNPYLEQRIAAYMQSHKTESKLFSHQSNLMSRNKMILDLEAQKIDGIRTRTARLLAKEKQPTLKPEINSLSVLNAAVTAHGKTPKRTMRALAGSLSNRTSDVGLLLTLVQLQVQNSKMGAATATVKAFLDRLEHSEDSELMDIRFSPGLVAIHVTLLKTQGRTRSVKQEITKALQYWRDRPSQSVSMLLTAAGVELARSSNEKDLALAGFTFEKLMKQDQSSDIASAGFVAALAPTNLERVREQASKLPSLESLVTGVDVKSLIDAGVATASKDTTSKKRAAPGDGAAADKSATKKRRKTRLPKNYVEGKTPDPERWLPLRDRSTYRPKGRKGKKKAAESTQGGTVKDEETLDLVGGGGVKVEKAAGGVQASKKKKKGKK